MSKKRNKLEIIRDILQIIQKKSGKIKPTHVLYKSNLSYQMMTDYIDELIQGGFINEKITGKNKTYIITDKGNKYLEKYRLIMEFTDSFGLN